MSKSKGPRTRGNNGASLGWSPKAQEPGVLMSKGGRRWMSQLKQRQQLCSSSAFLFCSGPQWIGWCPATLVRAVFFTQCTNEIVMFSRTILTCTLRSNVLPAISASFTAVKLTHKNNHYHPNQVHTLFCSWTSTCLVAWWLLFETCARSYKLKRNKTQWWKWPH